ncbi:hypothetical protein OVA24_06650 [Luteolibacter sp. SL250]|uniref:hypothetical protein n=1 Tax=Luteolibacter sp. SL250 TaxID=2995170 RepID=UPI00226DFA2C|nr:hypothetical protein [Luteolibacter sp. SL250]WAC21061.1 hypothetical protein OVA24_06650 [Luteolibacter sp. SL250]
MKFLAVVSIVFLAGLSAVVAQEKRKDGVSASGKIAWHVVNAGDNGVSEVFISEGDQGESAAQKLCEAISIANTEVFVSPDDSWMIVQTGGPSLGINLIAFRRENGMIYNEEKDPDIGDVALLAACGGDRKKADAMDHVYVRFTGWAADSKSLLLSVSARGGEKQKVESFFGIYDLAAKKIGYDLEKFNGVK